MATRINLFIDQGATFSKVIPYLDDDDVAINLTSGYTAAAQMRRNYAWTNASSFSITLGNGSLTLGMTAAETAALTYGRYIYDVELTNSVANTVTRVAEGVVTVSPNVTR